MSNAERTDLRKTTVGFVFQKYNLLPTLSAEDNIKIVEFIGGRLDRIYAGVCGGAEAAGDRKTG